MSRWFRWYRGTTENPKFRLAARNGKVTLVTVMSVWQCILEDAASENHRGVCEKREDFIAAALDLDDDGTVERALRGLEYVGLVSVGMGAITVIDWQKWQYEQDVSDPTNAERQRRFKDRKRNQSISVTVDNASVTVEKRPDTDTDTDTDTKTERKIDNPISLSKAAREIEPARPVAKPFPSDGSIQYGDFAEISRKAKPGVDPDVVAQAFRRFCKGADPPIPFDDPRIAKRFEGFAKSHRITGH